MNPFVQLLASPQVLQIVTINATESLSVAVDLKGHAVVGIIMPSAWTAANLTFDASVDGSTYNNLYSNAGTEISIVAGASRFIRLNPADWVATRYLKVRSGSASAPVVQTSNRDIKLVLKAV